MNLAILIDAENVLPAHADLIFSHAQSLGEVRYKEIFGAAQALGTWVEPVLKYAIHPNLTIRATKGKNTSDIALVIGAMDLLVAGGVDGVIIASSDSDFSGLSVRLRNAGIEVIGMGTEKSNPLWRTACSSFVVLQQPQAHAAAKPAARSSAKPAAQQQEKPAAEASPAAKQGKPASATHAERAAHIREFIEKRLESNGGRLQTGTIFTALNHLAEYRVDKQGSGKKPLNYLTSTFSDAFRFEETPDGKSWMSLLSVDPLPVEAGAEKSADADAPEAAEAPVEAEAAAEPAADAETAPETPAEAPAPKRSRRRGGSSRRGAKEAPATGDSAPAEAGEAKESTPIDADYYVDEVPRQDGPDPLALLIDAGLPEDVAEQIVVIFTESDSLRDAYNRLRSTFGTAVGREYYQKVKEIANAQ